MYRLAFIVIAFAILIIYLISNISIEEINKEKYIYVEIKGEVEKSECIKMPLGSTFEDLLNEVNLTDSADISCFSYLEILHNNQIINIPKLNNKELISINSANLEELCTLPGIKETTAKRIIEYRNQIGNFITLSDLMNVKGIGEKKYEKIIEYICL